MTAIFTIMSLIAEVLWCLYATERKWNMFVYFGGCLGIILLMAVFYSIN